MCHGSNHGNLLDLCVVSLEFGLKLLQVFVKSTFEKGEDDSEFSDWPS